MQRTEQIRQWLFDAILAGHFKPGEKVPTEQECMARFGASRITVRRAYGALEAAGILLRQRKVGTTVNASYSAHGGTLTSIGAIVPTDNAFSREFLEALCREAAAQDVLTILEPGNGSGMEQSRAARRLAAHGVRDVVVWGLDRGLDMELFGRLRILGVNLVFFDRIHPGKLADFVALDNASVVRQLVKKAVDAGAASLGFADPSELDIDSSVERCTAFRNACRQLGVSGQCVIGRGRAEKKVAAWIAVNDAAALSLRKDYPKTPIFSIDGTAEAAAAGIVSCRQPMAKMAQACFRALKEQRRAGAKWCAKEYRFEGDWSVLC